MEEIKIENKDGSHRFAVHTETGENIDLLSPAYGTDISVAGAVFEHYKSTEDEPKYYRLLMIKTSAETQEDLVIYEPMYASAAIDSYARPLAMFMGTVMVGEQSVPRFRYVTYDL